MLKTFRTVGYVEGASLLILFFIAMPLKYLAGNPQPVRMVGWVHGLLFIAYVCLLAIVRTEENWSFKKTIQGLLAAVLPFGTFVFDRSLRTKHPKN